MVTKYLEVSADGYSRKIAYQHQSKNGKENATLLWLSGYRSTMYGEKATAIGAWAKREGHEYLRFDYSGNGDSGGEFSAGTLTHWRDEALAVLNLMESTPPIIIGSSMGAWIALLVTKYLREHHPKRAPKALVLIAPAVDYTENIVPLRLTIQEQQQLEEDGVVILDSAYEENGHPLYLNYLRDAKQHLLLTQPIKLNTPLTIIHGEKDQDIPIQWGQKLAEMCHNESVVFRVIEDGDHRLSREDDINTIITAIEGYI